MSNPTTPAGRGDRPANTYQDLTAAIAQITIPRSNSREWDPETERTQEMVLPKDFREIGSAVEEPTTEYAIPRQRTR